MKSYFMSANVFENRKQEQVALVMAFGSHITPKTAIRRMAKIVIKRKEATHVAITAFNNVR